MRTATAFILSTLVLGAASPPATSSGEFVGLGADGSGVQLTLQQTDGLRAYDVAANARAREREAGGAWKDIQISSLQPGEPVTVVLGPNRTVTRIDAEYVSVAARLVGVEDGYVITTAGAAYKVVGEAATASANLTLGVYLLLWTDPASRIAFALTASRSPLTDSGTPAKSVVITFIVTVPVNTPAGDAIYIATNTRNWTPNAVRMTPLAGNRWTTTLTLSGGTLVEYKYTRGSWATDERNASGSDIPNRAVTVTSSGSPQSVADTVVRWADLSS